MTYSIIIPHKNTPDWLQRCIDSIPDRRDIQIIVVDDKSDIPAQEWESFRQRNPRVELYLTREGRGAGYARNVGLGKASGEWILFSDADDYFYEGAFDVLDGFTGRDNDLFFFPCDSRDGVSLEPIQDRMPSIRKNIRSGNLDGLRYRSIVPWGKMIRKALIDREGLRFEEVEVSNDVMFSIRLGVAAKDPGTIPTEPLYCCTRNEGSLAHKQTVRRVMTRVRVARRANDFLLERGLDRYQIPLLYVKSFLPWHPLLYLWGLWMFRDKRHPKEYWTGLFKMALAKLQMR